LDEKIYEPKQETIHAKGFDLFNFGYADPSKLTPE
jgi:hypothetical protein